MLLTCADLPLEGDLEAYSDTSYVPYSLSMIISNDDDQRKDSVSNTSHTQVKSKNRLPDALDFISILTMVIMIPLYLKHRIPGLYGKTFSRLYLLMNSTRLSLKEYLL